MTEYTHARGQHLVLRRSVPAGVARRWGCGGGYFFSWTGVVWPAPGNGGSGRFDDTVWAVTKSGRVHRTC